MNSALWSHVQIHYIFFENITEKSAESCLKCPLNSHVENAAVPSKEIPRLSFSQTILEPCLQSLSCDHPFRLEPWFALFPQTRLPRCCSHCRPLLSKYGRLAAVTPSRIRPIMSRIACHALFILPCSCLCWPLYITKATR